MCFELEPKRLVDIGPLETRPMMNNISHLAMTNIAMENPRTKWWFLAGKIIYKWTIFHGYSYGKLPFIMDIPNKHGDFP